MNRSLSLLDIQDIEGPVNFLFPCAQARLDALPKRLSNAGKSLILLKLFVKFFLFFYLGIHFDEIIVYETIPSDTLDQELNEYLKTHGVKSFFSSDQIS